MHPLRDRRRLGRASGILRIAGALAMALGCLCWPGVALAASPGSVDTSFGSGGTVSFAAGVQVFGVAAESDGGVVVAGRSALGTALVERLGPTGSVAGTWNGPPGVARSVAVTSDGKIVVGGTSNGQMFAARLTHGLTPDTTFNTTGVALAFAGQGAIGYGVAAAPDGGVVVAGSVGSGNTSFGVAKFSTGGSSLWAKSYGFGGFSVGRAVTVQKDGKIIVVGSQTPSRITNAVVARLNADGSTDSSFTGGGATTYSAPSTGFTMFTSVALQSNGQIVAAGLSEAGPTTVLVRFNTNGGLDSGFGSGGAASAPAGENVNVQDYPIGAYGVVLAAGGRPVAAGNYENTGTEIDQALWAFGPGGSAESSFGSGGTVRNPKGANEACALSVLPNGNLVAVGNTVRTFPDATPCEVSSGSSGYAVRYVGFGPVGNPTPPPPPPGKTLKVTVTGVKGSYKKSSLHGHGIKFGVGCNEACKVKVTLGGSAAVARQLRMSKTVHSCHKVKGKRKCKTTRKFVAFTISSASAQLRAGGTLTLTVLRVVPKAIQRSHKPVKLTLVINVTPPSGKAQRIQRTITLR